MSDRPTAEVPEGEKRVVQKQDNGDLHFYHRSGTPMLKLQVSEPAVAVNEMVMVDGRPRNHPFDARSEMLRREDVQAVREWCDAALASIPVEEGAGS